MARNMSRSQPGEPSAVAAKRPGGIGQKLDGDELRQRIAQAAYYRAQNRGFSPGYEEKDWLEAEAEVKGKLGLSPRT